MLFKSVIGSFKRFNVEQNDLLLCDQADIFTLMYNSST